MKKIIWVFNLETNLDSPVLASSHDWVEEFSKQFEIVNVYSTHLGRVNLPSNVHLREIGGGNFLNRARGLSRLFGAALRIFFLRSDSVVFHHMNSRSALILGFPLRIMRVRQVLWYSHSVASVDLVLAERFVNYVVTSFPGAYPRQNRKIRFIGHGIKETRFSQNRKIGKIETDILSIGRITQIKNLDKVLVAIASIKNDLHFNPTIKFIGPTGNQEYKEMLINVAQRNSINLIITPPLNYLELPSEYSKTSIYYTGTPKSVDKATLEAAISGCLIVSENDAVQHLTGMREVWNELGYEKIPAIGEQFTTLLQLSDSSAIPLRNIVSQTSRIKNNLPDTISRITTLLDEHE
jgi:glycosyltransferase involved in cell wall biosynthesis